MRFKIPFVIPPTPYFPCGTSFKSQFLLSHQQHPSQNSNSTRKQRAPICLLNAYFLKTINMARRRFAQLGNAPLKSHLQNNKALIYGHFVAFVCFLLFASYLCSNHRFQGIQAERGSLIPVRHRRLYFIKYSSSAGVVYISGVILGKDDGYCWYGDE